MRHAVRFALFAVCLSSLASPALAQTNPWEIGKKAVGGGYPLSGIITRSEIASTVPWSDPSSSSSSFLTATDSVGWETWQASAALPKCFSRATATMYLSSVRVMADSEWAGSGLHRNLEDLGCTPLDFPSQWMADLPTGKRVTRPDASRRAADARGYLSKALRHRPVSVRLLAYWFVAALLSVLKGKNA